MSEWIKFSDKTPKSGEIIIQAFIERGSIEASMTDVYHGPSCRWTHWIPMPPAPPHKPDRFEELWQSVYPGKELGEGPVKNRCREFYDHGVAEGRKSK